MIGQGIKKREVMNKDWMKAFAMLIGQVKDGHLPYGSISIVAKVYIVMLHLWHCTCSVHMTGQNISPETNSQKNDSR